MCIGDIVLIPFPFSELTKTKVRPSVVIAEIIDKYKDLVVSAISSVVHKELSCREFVINPGRINNLRVKSTIKVDRITVKREDMIAELGKLTEKELDKFKSVLSDMIK